MGRVMPGPKPKPPRLHSIDGGRSKKSAQKAVPEQRNEDLVRPDDLAEEAQPYWDKIVAFLKGRIATLAIDSLAVADLALCMARLDEAEAEVRAHGIVIQSYRGQTVKNPAEAVARNYRMAVMKWFACFGMDPSDRLRLGVSTPELSPQEEMERLISS